jgi:glycolate oxidase FAD binding subunit
VVKNVTGYDLPKLIAGSFGTLVALTEVTIKVVPAPETSCSVVAAGLDVAAASRMMTLALGSTAEPSGAAYLPESSQTVFRLEGSQSSVAYRCQVLTDLLRCESRVLASDASRSLWRSIRDLAHFRGETDRVLWLLSTPPAQSALVIARLSACFPDLRYSLDWGGGRIWLSHSVTGHSRAVSDVHSSLAEGGHATLLRAPKVLRQGDHVFMPEVPLPVLQRVRAAFDPLRIFNRGRLHSEM